MLESLEIGELGKEHDDMLPFSNTCAPARLNDVLGGGGQGQYMEITHLSEPRSKMWHCVLSPLHVEFQFLYVLWMENLQNFLDTMDRQRTDLQLYTTEMYGVLSLLSPLQ